MKDLKLIYKGQVQDKDRMESQFRAQATEAHWIFYYINHDNHKKREKAYPEKFAIEIIIYDQDKRRLNLRGRQIAILDGLVRAQVIPDDSPEWLTSVKTTFGGIDKTNPRAEILIRKVFENEG